MVGINHASAPVVNTENHRKLQKTTENLAKTHRKLFYLEIIENNLTALYTINVKKLQFIQRTVLGLDGQSRKNWHIITRCTSAI